MPDPNIVGPIERDRNARAVTLSSQNARIRLSVVIPCYNEERSLEACVATLLAIQDDTLELEVILVDDCSTDDSYAVAQRLAHGIPHFKLLRHAHNQGKGAALRTGIAQATGDFVAIQDADREYDPMDLKRLLGPLRDGIADVVIGSRFLSSGYHRVLYFWHSVGNKFLTLVSNMLTDLNLTDMESCYKVFRRDIIQSIRIEEDRFGFEPEVVAKMAQMRVRVYEMGISYQGRSYAEGKKIGARDGWRALYCILKYNLPRVPVVVQFCFYAFVGGIAAVVNFLLFVAFYRAGMGISLAALSAFFLAAGVNYLLSIWLLFRHRARWQTYTELLVFLGVVTVVGAFDMYCTKALTTIGIAAPISKLIATAFGLVFNFLGRRYLVFPEQANPDWKPQNPEE
ncbi:MAG TPA: bifunctional glycosyltransferase family 2/GtrA family protein [Polyangiaceae bacterium]